MQTTNPNTDLMRKVEFLSNFSAQELTELLQTFSGSNLQGNYENNTCLSLQTSIDENDENLTTVHHRYLRKYLLISNYYNTTYMVWAKSECILHLVLPDI